MDIDIIRTRELAIVHCCGRLVFGDGADRLRDLARQALLAGQDVVLDLGRATQVDAHGAGVLAELLAFARQKGLGLSLAGVNERVRRVLRVTGLESFVRDAAEFRIHAGASRSFPARTLRPDEAIPYSMAARP